MAQYKDIINYSLINRLRRKISDTCIIFNNLIRKESVKRRESDLYEVYTLQYKQDMDDLRELRDRCMHVADECNKIILDMNRYHIKQYYIEPDELGDDFEDLEDYKKQIPTEQPTEAPKQEEFDEDDW